MSNIYQYEHPFVTVDGIIFRFTNDRLEVLLTKRTEGPEAGKWSLPGGFVDIDKHLKDTLKEKVKQKTGVTDFYAEQLKTYDAIDRDPRGRIISVAYIGLTNKITNVGEWFQIGGEFIKHTKRGESIPLGFYDEKAEKINPYFDLAFDHRKIIEDAEQRIAGKLWYSNIAKYLLPEEFTIREAAQLYSIFEGHKTDTFRRKLGDRVKETKNIRTYGREGGRPAALFRWVD